MHPVQLCQFKINVYKYDIIPSNIIMCINEKNNA